MMGEVKLMVDNTKQWVVISTVLVLIIILLMIALSKKECEQIISEDEVNVAYGTGYQQALLNVVDAGKECTPFRVGVDNLTTVVIGAECK